MATKEDMQVQEIEWVETWEDALGRKWELRWWVDHNGTQAELSCHGRLIGRDGSPIGNPRAIDLICSDSVTPSLSGTLAEENYGFFGGIKVQFEYRGAKIGSAFVRKGIE